MSIIYVPPPQEAAMLQPGHQFMNLNRWLSLAVIALTGCAGSRPPADFLTANNAPWMVWMESVVDVHLKDVPISKLPETPPFHQMNISIGSNDASLLSLRISLDEKQLTHRQALWIIAQKYDLSMTVGYAGSRPFYVLISKRPDDSANEAKRR